MLIKSNIEVILWPLIGMNYFDLTFKKKERNWKQNKYMYFYYAGRATIPSYAILCYLVHYHKSKLKPINATESTDLINSGAKIRFIEWVVWAEDGAGVGGAHREFF